MQRDMFMLHLFIIILTCKYLVILWNTKIKQDSETSLMQKNAQSNVIETRLPIEKKYSIHIPFEVMDFLGNDYVIVSPKRFRESRLLDICYPGILMVLKKEN